MYSFHLTPEARIDLIEIQDFISQDNPAAAADVIDNIFKEFDNLSKHPLKGHKREDLTNRNIRFWNVHSYLIIYDATTKPISIVRVLSGYRDIQSMI